jgi:hypothetical protein
MPSNLHPCRRLEVKRLVLTALLLVATVSFARSAEEQLDRLEEFDAWVVQAFQPRALETAQGIRALGRLLSEKGHEFQNAHASTDSEMREFVFEGLAVYAVVEKTPPHRIWVTSVEITGPAWPLENGLAVGQDVAQLERIPVRPEAGTLRYCGVNNCLIAEERQGVITSLRIEAYFD